MSTVIHRFAPTRDGVTDTTVGGGPPGVRRRTVSVIASGATHATQTLTSVLVRRRSTGPATSPGNVPNGSGVESSATPSSPA